MQHRIAPIHDGNQQDAETAFVSDVSKRLCARPEQSSDNYYAILHNMTATVRAHTCTARAPHERAQLAPQVLYTAESHTART